MINHRSYDHTDFHNMIIPTMTPSRMAHSVSQSVGFSLSLSLFWEREFWYFEINRGKKLRIFYFTQHCRIAFSTHSLFLRSPRHARFENTKYSIYHWTSTWNCLSALLSSREPRCFDRNKCSSLRCWFCWHILSMAIALKRLCQRHYPSRFQSRRLHRYWCLEF